MVNVFPILRKVAANEVTQFIVAFGASMLSSKSHPALKWAVFAVNSVWFYDLNGLWMHLASCTKCQNTVFSACTICRKFIWKIIVTK